MMRSKWGRHIVDCMMLYLVSAAVILLIFLAARSVGIGFFELTKDPLAGQVKSTPIYSSILSNLGIMGWCFTVAIQFFAAWLIRRLDPASQVAAFLFQAGFITLMLMLDDFLMLHERMNHTVEAIIFGGYGILVATVFIRFRNVILQTNFLILGVALGCFLLSMVLDNVVERLSLVIPYRTMLEDAFKIIGIVGWVWYFIGLSIGSVRATVSAERDRSQ